MVFQVLLALPLLALCAVIGKSKDYRSGEKRNGEESTKNLRMGVSKEKG